ncbi:MAG: hypothetical protein JKY29_08310 [Gammaproteobacteria bacterium]|nr:hypothetical protein [Gammaproteobacteria bacterium]
MNSRTSDCASGQVTAIGDLVVIGVMSGPLVAHHKHGAEVGRAIGNEAVGRALAS